VLAEVRNVSTPLAESGSAEHCMTRPV
jgi:hypothetical protein